MQPKRLTQEHCFFFHFSTHSNRQLKYLFYYRLIFIVLFLFLWLLLGRAPADCLQGRGSRGTEPRDAVSPTLRVMQVGLVLTEPSCLRPALAACAPVLSLPLVWLPSQAEHPAFSVGSSFHQIGLLTSTSASIFNSARVHNQRDREAGTPFSSNDPRQGWRELRNHTCGI